MAAHAMAAVRPSCAAQLVSMCRGAERGLVLETAQACSVVVPGRQDQPGASDRRLKPCKVWMVSQLCEIQVTPQSVCAAEMMHWIIHALTQLLPHTHLRCAAGRWNPFNSQCCPDGQGPGERVVVACGTHGGLH